MKAAERIHISIVQMKNQKPSKTGHKGFLRVFILEHTGFEQLLNDHFFQ